MKIFPLLKYLYSLLILILFVTCSKEEYIPKKYVIIVAGQSQAVGLANNSELDNKIRSYNFTRTKIYSVIPDNLQIQKLVAYFPNYSKTTGWEQLNINFNQSINQNPGFHGIEPSFAYQFEMQYPKDTLFIIKFAYGGTLLSQQDKKIDWAPNSDKELYYFFSKVFLTQAIPTISNFTPLGFFWAQGESDGSDLISANNYLVNLQSFFQQLSKDVPAIQSFKKYIAKVTFMDSVALPFTQEVRDAQIKYCLNGLNNSVLIDCDKIELNQDKHFSAIGYQSITTNLFSLIFK